MWTVFNFRSNVRNFPLLNFFFFVTRHFLIYRAWVEHPSYKTSSSSKQNRGDGTFFQGAIKARPSTTGSTETEESSRPFNLVANQRPNAVLH